MLKDGVTQDELDKAKQGYLRSAKGSPHRRRALAGMLADLSHAGRTMEYYAELEKQIAALTPEQVIAAARKHFDPKKLVIVTAGDFAAEKASQYRAAMLSISEALSKVLANTGRKSASARAAGRRAWAGVAEDVTSDIDSPPHDKATVDGYAVVAADLAGGSAELSILEEVTAGAVPTLEVAQRRLHADHDGPPCAQRR